MDRREESKLCLWLKLPYTVVRKLTLPGPDEDLRDANNRERWFIFYSHTMYVVCVRYVSGVYM